MKSSRKQVSTWASSTSLVVGVQLQTEQEPNDIAIIGEGVHRTSLILFKLKDSEESIRSLVACWLHDLLVTRVTHNTGLMSVVVFVNFLDRHGAYHHVTNGSSRWTDWSGRVIKSLRENDKFASNENYPWRRLEICSWSIALEYGFSMIIVTM